MSPLSYDVDLWYLGGKMSGVKSFNIPAFFEARDDLVSQGLNIQLPADLDDPEIVALLMLSPDGSHTEGGPTWAECLAEDVKLLGDKVGGGIFLPSWPDSRGARLETFVLDRMFGKPCLLYPTLNPIPQPEMAQAWLGLKLWDEVHAVRTDLWVA